MIGGWGDKRILECGVRNAEFEILRFAILASSYEDCEGDLIAVMDARFKLFERSDIPSVHKNDTTFLQGEILLEDAFPWSLMISLKGEKYISERWRLKIQSDRSLQNEFSSKNINSKGHR